MATENFHHAASFFFGAEAAGTATVADLEAAGEAHCGADLATLRDRHPDADDETLAKYCFASAFVVATLRDALGVGAGVEGVPESAVKFGEAVNGVAVDWALGAAIAYAAEEGTGGDETEEAGAREGEGEIDARGRGRGRERGRGAALGGDAIARLGLLASLDDGEGRAWLAPRGRGGGFGGAGAPLGAREAAFVRRRRRVRRDGRPPPRGVGVGESQARRAPRAPVRGDAEQGRGHEPLAKRRRPRVRALGSRGASRRPKGTLMRAERDEARASLS